MAKANVANTLVVPTETKVFPYHDDFNEEKNFHRMLFRPGYGVQARELTQLQTILQNQIERFGQHIFVNGSPVVGGDVIIDRQVAHSINLSSEYLDTDIDVADFQDKIVQISDNDRSVVFKVRDVAAATSNTPPVLFGSYIGTDKFGSNTTIKVINEEIYANTASANVTASCQFAHIRDSIFFMNGFFLKTPQQSVAWSKFNERNANVKVGVEFSDSIITENSDTSLLDPALEAFNYQGPGAARLKLDLNLSTRALDSEDTENFIELARIEMGSLKKLTKTPIYSEIEEVFARRTYDESGNYTVSPFTLSYDETKYNSASNVNVYLSPGKAYIYGFEYETVSDTTIPVPRAKTKKSVSNYDLNMNYGNYVITSNHSGDFAQTEGGVFDIHCVYYTDIDRTNTATYATTHVGTGHAKSIDFYGGDSDVDARKYEFYFFDTNFNKISSNASSVSINTIQLYNSDTLLASVDGAYVGATLQINSGPGAVGSYNISSYDGTTKVIGLESSFTTLPDSTSNVSINFDIGTANSFIVDPYYTAGADWPRYANTNIVRTGRTSVLEPSLNTLVFKLPNKWISNGISDQVYSYTRKYENVEFTDGISETLASETYEQFIGTTTSSNVSSTVMNNFMVVVSEYGSTGRTYGEIVKVKSTVTGTAPEEAVLDTEASSGDTFTATVYAKMEYDPGIGNKQKSFVPANTQTFSSETASTTFENSTGSNTTVYLSAGQVLIQSPSRRADEKESLYISDVISAVKIYNLNGTIPSAGESIKDYEDVTNRYYFNNGQKDNFYDHAYISLKPDFAPVNGPLLVCTRYYSHTAPSGEGKYFSVDSYPSLATTISEEGVILGDGYSLIPDFTRSTGEVVSLRDCIDFRPARQNASNTSPNYTLSDADIPVPTTDFEVSYDYYLGRKDLLILDANRNFQRVEGIPDLNPKAPAPPARSMVLYELNVEPYTKYASNVSAKYIENKRYTMRDIGKIDRRVQNLEYYVSLNTLEKEATDLIIQDVDGLERTKYGVFVDGFKSHALSGHLENPWPEYRIAMDLKEGKLINPTNSVAFDLKANTAQSTNVTFNADRVTLSYTEIPFVSQHAATKFAPVAELLHSSFIGTIITLPEADNWKDTSKAPDIIYTDYSNTVTTLTNTYQTIVTS